MTETPTPSNYYVDPKEFYDEIVAFRPIYLAAKANGDYPRPKIPDSIAKKLLLIATRVSLKPNFRNYSFRDDMIMDGVENCIRYFHSFDPDKSSSPFSYFTTTLCRQFIARIQTERKQRYLKYKAMKALTPIVGSSSSDASGSGDEMENTTIDNENIDDFIRKYDEYLARKKVPKNRARLACDSSYSSALEKLLSSSLDDDNNDEAV
ncbi:MAG: hypothetical protein DDT26_00425 [Dehalococcoidia bacterium]|nr:hypothetical protein [Chloroflexota bacterium]